MLGRLAVLAPFSALLASVSLMMLGTGFLGTIVGLHVAEIGYTTLEAGLLSTSYYAGILIASLTAHHLIRLAGHIRTFAALASTLSAATLSHAFFDHFYFFCSLRLLEGFTLCGLYICVESWLSDQSESSNRGLVLSAYTFVFFISYGLAQYLLLLDIHSWFFQYGLASIILSLALVPLSLTRTEQPPAPSPLRLPLLKLIRTTPIGVLVSIAAGIVWASFAGLLPFLAPHFHISTQEVAYVLSAFVFGTVAFQAPMSQIADRFDRRLILTALCVGTTLVTSVIILVGSSSVPLFIALVFVFGGFSGTLYPIALAHASDRVDHSLIVSTIGGLLLVNSLGAAFGPIIAPFFIQEDGASGLFGFFTIVMAIVSVFCLFRWRTAKPLREEARGDYQLIPSTLPYLSELNPRAYDDQFSFDFDGDGIGDGGPLPFIQEAEPELTEKL